MECVELKAAAADMRYFTRSKFFGSFAHRKDFGLISEVVFQLKMLILSREAGYLFSV